MGYSAALNKAWETLAKLSDKKTHSVSLLSDTYEVRVEDRKVSSVSCNVPAKDFLSILLLHYIIGSLKESYSPSGEWISFKDIEGGEIYFPAFHESAIKPLVRKYGAKPEALLEVLKRLPGKKIDIGDFGVEIKTFPDIYVRVVMWKGDDEFGPEGTILFDKNLTKVYSTEDIAVFLRFIIHGL